MRKAKLNQLLRDQLHLSQEDFALYLGVSRSLLSLYEKGLRSLPTPALLKLGSLETLYNHSMQKKFIVPENKVASRELQKHDEKMRKLFQLNKKKCQYKIFQLEHQLNDMIDKHARAKAWSELLTVLLEVAAVEKSNKDRRLLEVQQDSVIKKLVRLGNASQAKLRVQIEILKAGEAANTKWAEQI